MPVSPPPLVYRSSGRRLYVRRSGSGPPLLLIHGLSGSRHWWRYNLPALEARHTVYVVELVGYGRGWGQRSLGVREAARLIGDWLQAQDMQQVAVIGHSMGGHIALRLAELEQARLSRLVLACASGLLHQRWWRMALRLPGAVVTGRPGFLPVILADSLRAGLPNLIRSSRDLLRDDVADLLPTLHLPTLVIWGERDVLVPLPLGRALAQGIPGAEFLSVPGAGHVVMVDRPATFNRAVLDFLDPQAAAS
ncbi:alpha/beta hydrolase [Deinococcus sonorensis]|uniref:Alpha/beta hydrolase n=2 Tax=Deinococcus sonorensis TaxID=309891 RepID=A0AAU7U8S0_9DEIO